MENKSEQNLKCEKVSSKKVSNELLKIENPTVSSDEHIKSLFSDSNMRDKSKFMMGIDSSNNETIVLNRVRNFLPIIKKANEDIKVAIEKGENVDIEHVDENEAKELIEMNLALLDNGSESSSDEDDECILKDFKIPGSNNLSVQNSTPLISEYKDEDNDKLKF